MCTNTKYSLERTTTVQK